MHIHRLIHPTVRLADEVAVQDDRRSTVVEAAARPNYLRSLRLRYGKVVFAYIEYGHLVLLDALPGRKLQHLHIRLSVALLPMASLFFSSLAPRRRPCVPRCVQLLLSRFLY